MHAHELFKRLLPLRSANRESRMPVSVEDSHAMVHYSWTYAVWHMTGLSLGAETGHKCKVAAGKCAH